MKKVSLPWGSWYGDKKHDIWFPDTWEVIVPRMSDVQGMDEDTVLQSIMHPIGSPRLGKLAENKKTACILVDDLTRPTRGELIIDMIIRQLETAGLCRNDIVVIISNGAHRPLLRSDIIKKVGKNIVNTVEVVNHNPFSNDLVCLGKSSMGSTIRLNRRFMEADLKIAVGCILPHTGAGFGGGAKSVVPGIAGIETLTANHSMFYYEKDGEKYGTNCTGNPDNCLRNDMEDIACKAGLSFIVNVVMNSRHEIAGVFAGDIVKAHRKGCDFAKKVYRIELVEHADIVVLNAYPKDMKYLEVSTALTVLGTDLKECFRNENSSIVLTTASSEGTGVHYLNQPGMNLFTPHENFLPPEEIKVLDTVIYSTNLKSHDLKQFFRKQPLKVYNQWDDLLKWLASKHKEMAKVAIYTMGSLQIGAVKGKIQTGNQ